MRRRPPMSHYSPAESRYQGDARSYVSNSGAHHHRGLFPCSKGVQSVSDKDADAKNYKKCCNSLKHGDPEDCSSKQRCWLHSQNDLLVALTFWARLVPPSNGLSLRTR